jgi:hypothetical protein
MKVAAMTKTVLRAGSARRVEALSLCCFSFLAAVRPKLQRGMMAEKHTKVPSICYFSPRPASACAMLTESDIRGGSHGILP